MADLVRKIKAAAARMSGIASKAKSATARMADALRDGARRASAFVVKNFDLNDLHAYGGLAMIWYGVGIESPAAAWACTGLMLFWLAVRQ